MLRGWALTSAFVSLSEENVRAARAFRMNGHVFDGQDELAAAVDVWLPTG